MPSSAQRPLKVMIAGGGTGGHIFPAIAIAQAVREREPDARFLFVGAEGRMEMQKVAAAGFAIEALPIRGFQRGSVIKNLGLPWRLLRSMLKARRLVKDFKPHVNSIPNQKRYMKCWRRLILIRSVRWRRC